jgi:ABC-type glycerol-3-phosphate transport system substrate-binding protein
MKKKVRVVLVFVFVCVFFIASIGMAKTKLRYWTFLDPTSPGPRSQVQNKLIEEFMKKHPDIEVQLETIHWAKIDPMLFSSVKGGTAPDVSRFLVSWLPAHVAADNLEPLDSIKQWSEEETADWVLPWDSTVINGHKWGLFIEHRVRVLYYRKDVLDQAGLAVPSTLYELLETAEKITTKNMSGFINAESTKTSGSWAENFYPLHTGAGGKTFKEDGTAGFNDAAAVKVFQWVKDIFYKYKINPKSYTSLSMEEIEQAFIAGRCSMYLQGSHRLGQVRQRSKLGENVQTAPIPGFTSDKPSSANTMGWMLVIPKGGAKDKKSALEFIEHMVSREAQLMRATESLEMPSRKSVYDDPWFKSDKAKDMLSWMKYSNTYPLLPPPTKHWTLYGDCIAEATEQMVFNDLEPKKVLDEAVEKFNRLAGFK